MWSLWSLLPPRGLGLARGVVRLGWLVDEGAFSAGGWFRHCGPEQLLLG